MASPARDERFINARLYDRPRIRDGSSDPELAIFDATEQLLTEVDFGDLSVSKIIENSGISRATFYHYFSSKLGVIAGMLVRVMDDVFAAASPFLHHDGAASTTESLQLSMHSAMSSWAKHRTLLRVVMENFASDRELQALWLGAMSRFASAVAAEIDAERAAGKLPPGRDSLQLATSLVWCTERCLYIGGRGVEPTMSGELATVDTLVNVWAGALLLGDAAEQ